MENIVASRWFGFNPPFLGGSQNVMSKQMDERLIKNDILQLLLTIPGERVMRPDFGTKLRLYPFELSDDNGELDELRSDIIDKIEQYEERVKVKDVVITPSELHHTLIVSVTVSPVSQPLVNYLIEVKTSNTSGDS